MPAASIHKSARTRRQLRSCKAARRSWSMRNTDADPLAAGTGAAFFGSGRDTASAAGDEGASGGMGVVAPNPVSCVGFASAAEGGATKRSERESAKSIRASQQIDVFKRLYH